MSDVTPLTATSPAAPRIRPAAVGGRPVPARPAFAVDHLELPPRPSRPLPARDFNKPLLTPNQKFAFLCGGGLGATFGLVYAALHSPVLGLTEAAAGWLGLGGLVGVALAAALVFGIPALIRLFKNK